MCSFEGILIHSPLNRIDLWEVLAAVGEKCQQYKADPGSLLHGAAAECVG